jgi:hypothetical protein
MLGMNVHARRIVAVSVGEVHAKGSPLFRSFV